MRGRRISVRARVGLHGPRVFRAHHDSERGGQVGGGTCASFLPRDRSPLWRQTPSVGAPPVKDDGEALPKAVGDPAWDAVRVLETLRHVRQRLELRAEILGLSRCFLVHTSLRYFIVRVNVEEHAP